MKENKYCDKNKSALEYNTSIGDSLLEIISPLKDFGVNDFGYAKFYPDQSYVDLFSNIPWQKIYYESFNCTNIIRSDLEYLSRTQGSIIFWGNTDIERQSPIVDESYKLDIWHGLRIYNYSDKAIEVWHFATTRDNEQINNFYVNNIDLFKKFIVYFNNKAKSFVETAENFKAVLPESVFNSLNPAPVKLSFPWENNIKKHKIKIGENHEEVFLSKREAECTFHAYNHKTIKEIARELNLSSRTVEFYLNNVRKKTHCYSKRDLMKLYAENKCS